MFEGGRKMPKPPENDERETDEFLSTLVLRLPDSSENLNEDPEETEKMLQRELDWLNFPKVEGGQ